MAILATKLIFTKEPVGYLPLKMQEIYKINEINMTDMQKSFWLSSKHIVSSVLKNEFDYKFIHPDYKSGLKAIWKMKN